MTLMDKIRADAAHAKKRPPCRLGVVLDQMTLADRNDLEAALADATFTSVTISRVLIDDGWNVDRDGKVVRQHRKGACGCAR